jgi:hypothetical protein
MILFFNQQLRIKELQVQVYLEGFRSGKKVTPKKINYSYKSYKNSMKLTASEFSYWTTFFQLYSKALLPSHTKYVLY